MKQREDDGEDRRHHGLEECAKSGSPRAPIASEVIVTPSCIAAMNRGGSAVIRRTARARRLPCVARARGSGCAAR